MDLRITSTGRLFSSVDSTLVAILLEAFPASFEAVVPVPPVPASSAWVYFLAPTPGGAFAIQRRRPSTGEVEILPAHPDKVNAAWPDAPATLIGRYAALSGRERIA